MAMTMEDGQLLFLFFERKEIENEKKKILGSKTPGYLQNLSYICLPGFIIDNSPCPATIMITRACGRGKSRIFCQTGSKGLSHSLSGSLSTQYVYVSHPLSGQ